MKSNSRLILALMCVAAIGLGALSSFGIGRNHVMGVANIRQGLDLQGGVTILYEADVDNPSNEDMNAANNMLRRRLDGKNYTEADTARQGFRQIRVDIPGVDDAEAAIEEIGKMALLYFTDEDGTVLLTGNEVDRAWRGTASTSAGRSQVVVHIEFKSEGARLFEQATRDNLGKQILIWLDEELLSYPTVNTVIPDGRCYIEGNFDAKSAEALAKLINEGSLPFKFNVISMRNVGARLGADALTTSVIAGLIGLVLVLFAMGWFFKVSGLAANLALIIYTGLVLVILSLFRITLTLPGIAGIILSIGMAVDANVIIFERLREEISAGRTLRASVDAAFKRALPAIIDSNITTLIASVVLYWLGTGPIKGFAQTLSIGVAVSMFTALTVTRVIIINVIGAGFSKPDLFYRVRKASTQKVMPVVAKKRVWFIFSGAVIFTGVLVMALNGIMGNGLFKYDVEFSGGTSFEIELEQTFSNSEIEGIVSGVTGQSAPRVQKINPTQVLITIRSIDAEQRGDLMDALSERYGVGRDNFIYSDFSPTVSADMQRAALLAVTVAGVCMLLYMSFRFKDFRMGGSAVIAQIHDALVVLAVYAVMRIPLNLAFIAVIMTVIGYSTNATIVIFDRIRENKTLMRKAGVPELVDTSVTQTLRRSVISTLTTLVSVVTLWIIGVPSIKDFMLPIIVGLLFGTYSSVFLSGSLWHLFTGNRVRG